MVPWRVLSVVTIAAALFSLLPGDLRHKALLVLQGVCAQRPSHSFQFSGQPLPVDARMTGMYLAAASTLLWYLLICQARVSGRFTRPAWVILALFIGVMALDGLNSLATDVGVATFYVSTNLTRLVTGSLSGIAIGALLSHLATISLTRRPRGGWAPVGLRTLTPPAILAALMCGLAASGLPTLALPYTWLILASALVVLWAIASVLVALSLQRAWGFASARQKDETLAMAFVVACALLAVFASARTVLEQLVGPLNLS